MSIQLAFCHTLNIDLSSPIPYQDSYTTVASDTTRQQTAPDVSSSVLSLQQVLSEPSSTSTPLLLSHHQEHRDRSQWKDDIKQILQSQNRPWLNDLQIYIQKNTIDFSSLLQMEEEVYILFKKKIEHLFCLLRDVPIKNIIHPHIQIIYTFLSFSQRVECLSDIVSIFRSLKNSIDPNVEQLFTSSIVSKNTNGIIAGWDLISHICTYLLKNAPQLFLACLQQPHRCIKVKKNCDLPVSLIFHHCVSDKFPNIVQVYATGHVIGSGTSKKVKKLYPISTFAPAILTKASSLLKPSPSLDPCGPIDVQQNNAFISEDTTCSFLRKAQVPYILFVEHVIIVSLFKDITVHSKKSVLFSRWCPYSSLEVAIVEAKIPFNEQLTLFSQIVTTIGKIHTLQCIHLDIKHENICVTKIEGRWQVKICDFNTMRLPSQPCGYLSSYPSPEMVVAKHNKLPIYPTFAADSWSIGLILTSLLLDKNPTHFSLHHTCTKDLYTYFENIELLYSRLNETRQEDDTVVRRHLVDLALRLLSVDFRLRPSMSEVLQEIEQVQITNSQDQNQL